MKAEELVPLQNLRRTSDYHVW